MNHDVFLLAEDDPRDVQLIQRAFGKAGIGQPVHVVRDGEEAVAYLAGTGPYADRGQYPLPDVLLLDIKMPRKSGLEVLAWLRAQPGLRRLRVAILTSSRESPDINRAHDLGVSSYLVKPVDTAQLVTMLETLNRLLVVHAEKPELTLV
jgi:CheY-like chemotaxis protein